MYNWETGGCAVHRKKVKKAGTVVLHNDETVDTSFEKFSKEYPLHAICGGNRQNPSSSRFGSENKKKSLDDDEDASQFVSHLDKTKQKCAMMTIGTKQVLTDVKNKFKFDALLPCQAQCYRGIFKGRDVILHSRTGSGKTLAYALPIIERYFLLDLDATASSSGSQTVVVDKKSKQSKENNNINLPAPFLLIFVFSTELAYQTRTILDDIYGERGLKVAVAGMDDVSQYGTINVLIGTVSAIDATVRGKNAPIHQKKRKSAQKRLRKEEASDDKENGSKGKNAVDAQDLPLVNDETEDSEDDDDISSDESDDENMKQTKFSDAKKHSHQGTPVVLPSPTVSAKQVRAIVIDEVDMTLGPRFSTIGQRMKCLLKQVRRSNGALQPTRLLNDFRAHHYVLCGATIPNWVIKTGFLGIKKYYYQLIEVGTRKLPSSLECFVVDVAADTVPMKAWEEEKNSTNLKTVAVDKISNVAKKEERDYESACKLSVSARLHTVLELIDKSPSLKNGWGRIVIFGSTFQIDELERGMGVVLAAYNVFKKKKKEEEDSLKKNKHIKQQKQSENSENSFLKALSSFNFSSHTGWKHIVGVRSLSSSKDEVERITNISDFNDGSANILLCTDVASRGLDFVAVDVVFMLSLPRSFIMAAETFTHRAGRTARVNKAGKCVAIVNYEKDEEIIKAIEASTHVRFKRWVFNNNNNNNKFSDSKPETKDGKDNHLQLKEDDSSESHIIYTLTVRSSFFLMTNAPHTATAANVKKTAYVSTPMEVLETHLKNKIDSEVPECSDLYSLLVKGLEVTKKVDDKATTVKFSTPAKYDHILKQKLWKYDLRQVKQ